MTEIGAVLSLPPARACSAKGGGTECLLCSINKKPRDHLLSHALSSTVPSAGKGLTAGFGMCPGVSPSRIMSRDKNSQLHTVLEEKEI